MKVWTAQACIWHNCPHQRKYREVGTVLADDIWDALVKAEEKFADALTDEETICLAPIGTERSPTRFELIDADE